jgi:hypothetical protein
VQHRYRNAPNTVAQVSSEARMRLILYSLASADVPWRIICSAASGVSTSGFRHLRTDFRTPLRRDRVPNSLQARCVSGGSNATFFIRTTELLHDDVVSSRNRPLPSSEGPKFKGALANGKDKLAYPENPQYTPMSLKHDVNFFLAWLRIMRLLGMPLSDLVLTNRWAPKRRSDCILIQRPTPPALFPYGSEQRQGGQGSASEPERQKAA